jgi:hypothetical protein
VARGGEEEEEAAGWLGVELDDLSHRGQWQSAHRRAQPRRCWWAVAGAARGGSWTAGEQANGAAGRVKAPPDLRASGEAWREKERMRRER